MAFSPAVNVGQLSHTFKVWLMKEVISDVNPPHTWLFHSNNGQKLIYLFFLPISIGH